MIPSIESFLAVVGNWGFPLVLAVYLLIRFEKRIDLLTEAIATLKESINNNEGK
ncbi:MULTISPECIES: YvrJ family protein [unclassified Oceanobacillus]|uniref:YvrJ family protein n=1 Tax=unclassified Oceanobacillus TaxID=2630292 RepID=UPI00300DDFCC